MKPIFADYNVQVVALSKDSPGDASKHMTRDDLQLKLLSDEKMQVISQYGLEHHKALEFKTWLIFGLPLGYPTGFKRMAIPTSILVDENGTICWIDQADDYRLRGDEQRIKDALEQCFSAKA